jgi:hypothetical protein
LAKRRIPIPTRISVEVEYSSDRTCCVCRKPDEDYQIDHIDDDPSNNTFENLAVLCLRCHNKATKTGGVARSLSPELIKKYREEWYAMVRERRGAHRSEILADDAGKPKSNVEEYITAQAIHDVRNLHRDVFSKRGGRDWNEAERVIRKLSGYVVGSTEERDPRVKLEVMLALDYIGHFARDRMPANVAFQLGSVAGTALPDWHRVQKGGFHPSEVEAYSYAAIIGHALVYEGAIYLKQFKICEYGALLLWQVLRDGTVGKSKEVVQSATRAIDWMLADKRIAPPDDVGRLLVLYRDQAAKSPGREFPELPIDLYRKL